MTWHPLIQRHQQVHIADWPGLTARRRTEDFQPPDGMPFAGLLAGNL